MASCFIAAVILVALAACAPSTTGERMTAAELHRLVPGATLEGTVASGGTFAGTYHRDGTMAIRTDDDSDTGTWEFEDDMVCLTWTKWRDGQRYCIYWEKTATGYVSRFPDGRLSTTFDFID